MQPTLTVGDLVVTRPAPSYRVGDVVAVRTVDGPVIVHRVIASDEGLIRTRGDANDFTDPESFSPEQVLGRMALRVPAVGRWVGAVRSGGLMGIVVALLVFLIGFGSLRENAQARPKRQQPRDPSQVQHAALAVFSAGLLMLAAGLVAPSRQAGSVPVSHEAAFTTGGPAPRGAVYPDGRVPDGQPFYVSLVDEARVYLAVATSAEGRQVATSGRWTMTASLASSAGWSRSFALGGGSLNNGRATGRLDLSAARAALRGFEASSGDREGFYPLTVRAVVDLEGTLEGVGFTRRLTPSLALRFDQRRLFRDETAVAEPLIDQTAVTVPGAAAGTLHIAGRAIPTQALRTFAAFLLLLGAALAVASVLIPVRERASARGFEGPPVADPWG